MSIIHSMQFKALTHSAVYAAIIFGSIAICISYLGQRAHEVNRESLDNHLRTVAEHAAALVDGDLHEKLLADGETGTRLYVEMITPLVKLHSVSPEIHYLYTMKDTGVNLVYGLDTAWSDQLKTSYEDLEAEDVGAVYEVSEEDYKAWADRVRIEGTHVDEDFIVDETGNFITASAPFFNAKGEYVGFVGVDISPPFYFAYQRDITNSVRYGYILGALLSLLFSFGVYRKQLAIEKLQQNLYNQTIKDALTGCFNRRHFEYERERLEEQYRRDGREFSLALLDIDHFKSVNDVHGHDVGDTIIMEVAKVLKTQIRKNDQLFRIGGEEFVILLYATDQSTAEKVSDRCINAIRKYSFGNKHDLDLTVTLSVGLATFDGDADIYKTADLALYEAKNNGRDQIVLAS